jgi:hypothetical protein
VRQDDPRLTPMIGDGQQIRVAVQLVSDVEGLRLVLPSCLPDRYRAKVSDDGTVPGCGGDEGWHPAPVRGYIVKAAAWASADVSRRT